MEFPWLYISALECVPNNNDAINETLDLQRDLHAADFALGEEYTFGIRTLLLAIPFLSQRVALRSMLKAFPRLLSTVQLSASVSWWQGCVFV